MTGTVKLGAAAEINPKGPSSSQMSPDALCDFVPMSAVGEDGNMFVAERRPYREVSKGYTPFRSDDVLVAKITPCFENGKIALAKTRSEFAFGSTEFHVIRCRDTKLHPKYLLHFLRQERIRHEGEKRMTGSAGQKRVPRQFFEGLDLPIHSLAEQRRIAAILDRADAVRRKRDLAIALADDFLKSVFLDMFGDPASNKKGLNKTPLGEIIRVSSGNGLIAKNMARDGIYPVYGGNGINGYHSEFMFEEPQIVIGRVGVYCGAVHVSEPKSWITDNALYVREFKKRINKTYLEWALRFANLNQYAGRAAQPLISGGRIYEVNILDPEIRQQEVFERLVVDHRALRSKLSRDSELSNQLFSALSQHAFRGVS
jgi:type I restriction enzyme, S subunit